MFVCCSGDVGVGSGLKGDLSEPKAAVAARKELDKAELRDRRLLWLISELKKYGQPRKMSTRIIGKQPCMWFRCQMMHGAESQSHRNLDPNIAGPLGIGSVLSATFPLGFSDYFDEKWALVCLFCTPGIHPQRGMFGSGPDSALGRGGLLMQGNERHNVFALGQTPTRGKYLEVSYAFDQESMSEPEPDSNSVAAPDPAEAAVEGE